MPIYSQSSKDKLGEVHEDLQILFNEVIKYVDCTIVSGLRTTEDQVALYAKGRTESGRIVTYKDGITNKSYHQSGNAIDIVPYPELYSDEDKLIEFGGFVMGVTAILKARGDIKSEIEWGYQLWGWDKPHFQIKI